MLTLTKKKKKKFRMINENFKISDKNMCTYTSLQHKTIFENFFLHGAWLYATKQYIPVFVSRIFMSVN